MNIENKIPLGGKLKQLRQIRHLSQEDVSRYLCLGQNIIEYIEIAEDDTLFSNVFYRGYVRSYAKLVGFPESELNSYLNATQRIVPVTQQAQSVSSNNVIERFNFGMQKQKIMLLAGIAAGALLLLFLVMFLLGRSSKNDDSTPHEQPNDEQLISLDTEQRGQLPALIDTLVYELIMHASQDNAQTDEEQISDAGASDMDKFILQLEREDRARTTESQQITGTKKQPILQFTFKANCWLKIADEKKNKTLFVGTKHKGEQLVFNQATSYLITIGNIDFVDQIMFEGQPVDLTLYIKKNNSAQFILNVAND